MHSNTLFIKLDLISDLIICPSCFLSADYTSNEKLRIVKSSGRNCTVKAENAFIRAQNEEGFEKLRCVEGILHSLYNTYHLYEGQWLFCLPSYEKEPKERNGSG